MTVPRIAKGVGMNKEHLCKLTTQDMTTHNRYQWKLGDWYETSGEGDLCGPGWLHGYTHPLLAVLLNPMHAGIENPRLFEIEIDGKRKENRGLKFGATKMRLVKEIDLPEVTTEQRVTFGILCALEAYDEPAFEKWAHGWLDGSDRSEASAEAAAEAAWTAAWTAAGAAAEAAWTAAWTAAGAAAGAAARAAGAASRAAVRATRAADIDLIALAQKAMEE